jgi:hypothetical protein
MVTILPPAEQRLRLSAIPWGTYVLCSDSLGHRHIRVTYDRGEMEVMTLSPKHENRKKAIGPFGGSIDRGDGYRHCELRVHDLSPA